MKILVLTNEKLNGVLFYRSILPHAYMAKDHTVHYTDMILQISDDELETFDILHVSYFMWDKWDIDRCKKLGLKIVVDIDDYWVVDRFHELYQHFKDTNRVAMVANVIKNSDAVVTTTENLKQKISIYGDNICVIPNVLMEDNYVSPKSNKIPFFAWVGGNNHTADLFIIQHLQKGYNHPVFIPEMYRMVFKDRFLYYNQQPIPNYLGLYNEYDIILISLRDAEFNRYKSPLKIMEAGMFKKPCIVSDVEPFSEHLKHKENCLVVKKHSQWAKWAKLLSNDAAMRKELGHNLNSYVLKHFSAEDANAKRVTFYKSLL